MKRLFLIFLPIYLLAHAALVYGEILITSLDDVTVATQANLARNLVIKEHFCVASNPETVYGLRAIGSGDDGEFSIQNGPYSIDYNVSFRDRRAGTRYVELKPGVPISGFLTRPLSNARSCRGNAGRLRIIIRKDTLNAAVAGRYRGVLQLSVIPE